MDLLLRLLGSRLLLSSPVMPVQISVALSQLGTTIDEMAGKEKVVSGGDSKGVSHKGTGVDDESSGHLSRDPT